jgi:predicted Zn-dependent protease
VNEILKSPKIEKAGVYQYSVKIILKDSILNAFALPGGPVYVYTGLLKYLNSQSALAGVIGHEIAHAERRHATTRMTQQYGIAMLLSVVLGEKPTQVAEIVANLFAGLALLQNSRANEDESDQYSFEYLKSTKYYPGSVKFFFEKLKADGLITSGSGGLESFLSTHPQPELRISLTDSRLTQAGIQIISYNYTGATPNLYKTEYQSNIVSKLP